MHVIFAALTLNGGMIVTATLGAMTMLGLTNVNSVTKHINKVATERATEISITVLITSKLGE